MKKFAITIQLLLLFAVLSITMQAQQWQSIWTGVTDDLYDICCIDENTIFVCGQNGVILKSVNGGVTWQEKHREAGRQALSIRFADNGIGYCSMGNGPDWILKTEDYGETWYPTIYKVVGVKNKQRFNFYDITYWLWYGKPSELHVINSDILFESNVGSLGRSTDGGVTFEHMEIDFYYECNVYAYFEDNNGFAIGLDDNNHKLLKVWRTNDYGESWENIANYELSGCRLYDVYFKDMENIQIYGLFNCGNYTYFIIESNDGFISSTMKSCNYFNNSIFSLSFFDIEFVREKGCVINSWEYDKDLWYGSLSHISGNEGVSWTSVSQGLNTHAFMFGLTGCNNTFLVSSQSGWLYKYDDGTTQDILENKIKTEVFPNPAADKIEICSENAHTIELYDVFGKKVFGTFVENNNTSIDISKLPAGVYTVVIQNNSGAIHTEKVVKL